MSMSRDPSVSAEVKLASIQAAITLGHVVFRVHCQMHNESGELVEAISFEAVGPTVPRKGEGMILENGVVCAVQNVYWRVLGARDEDGRLLSTVLGAEVHATTIPDAKLTRPQDQPE